MAKGPQRVKDFKFPASHGFSGSAGKTYVQPHMRGGPVKKALGGIVSTPTVQSGSGYVSPLRSMAARKAAQTRKSSGGLKHLVD